jgi:hypothetical protein
MKIYKFREKEDYIFYLSEIISDTIKYKERLKRYLDEINDLLKANPHSKVIDTVLYESVSDKIKAILYYLFNLLGDESKSAISYRKFRKLLVKGNSCLDIKLEALSNEEAQISNSFNQLRNWGLHIPESLFTNKRKVFEITSGEIDKYKETVALEVYEYFEIEYLTTLKSEIDSVVESIEILEKRMQQDYSKLISGDFKVSLIHLKVKPYKIMDVVEASFNTQTNKNT